MTEAIGTIEILNVGLGHLKLTVTEGDAIEIEKARRVIGDMLHRGYAIFVEAEDGTLSRVHSFDPARLVYFMDDTMDTVRAENDPESAAEDVDAVPVKERKPGKKGRPRKEVAVAHSKTVAVGRSAGG